MDLRHPDSNKFLEGSSGSNGPSVAVRVLEESKIVCLNILLEHIYNSLVIWVAMGLSANFLFLRPKLQQTAKCLHQDDLCLWSINHRISCGFQKHAYLYS